MATQEEELKLKELSDKLSSAVYNTPKFSTGASEYIIRKCLDDATAARKAYRDYRKSLDNPKGRYNPF